MENKVKILGAEIIKSNTTDPYANYRWTRYTVSFKGPAEDIKANLPAELRDFYRDGYTRRLESVQQVRRSGVFLVTVCHRDSLGD